MKRRGITLARAQELHAIRDKLTGDLRVRGEHIGKGRHVEMPESWDGNGKVPPGWSGYDGAHEETEQVVTVDSQTGARVVSYVGLGTYAVGLPADTPARLNGPDGNRLTGQERALLAQEFAAIETESDAPQAQPQRKKS